MKTVSFFAIEFAYCHDKCQNEEIEVAVLVVDVVVQESHCKQYASARDTKEKVDVDIHVSSHTTEFKNSKDIDNKEQYVKTNGVYENTPC